MEECILMTTNGKRLTLRTGTKTSKTKCSFSHRFTDGSKQGINLLSVAVHEVGHALGLRHSKKKSSVMYKLYQKYRGKNIKLDSDDIKAIKELYSIDPSDRGGVKCKDKDQRTCVQYKKEGYCQFKDIMKKFCQFTCDLCDS